MITVSTSLVFWLAILLGITGGMVFGYLASWYCGILPSQMKVAELKHLVGTYQRYWEPIRLSPKGRRARWAQEGRLLAAVKNEGGGT